MAHTAIPTPVARPETGPASWLTLPPRRAWAAAALFLVLVHCVASLFLRHSYPLTVFGDSIQSLLLLLATGVMASNVSRARGTTRVFWGLMTAGCGLWLLATLLWTCFEVVLRQEAPNPFVGDVILFIHIVPMMAALALRPHIEREHRHIVFGSLDLVLLLLWWLYLYLFTVIPWQYVDPVVAVYGYNFNLLYLAESLVFIVGLAVLVLSTSGGWRRFYAHLCGAAVLYAASSQFASVAIDQGRYYTGSIYDVPLITAMGWFTWAALPAGSLRPLPLPQEQEDSARLPLWPARLAMLAVLSTPFLAFAAIFDPGDPRVVSHYRLLLTLGAVFVLTSLVFIKQFMLDRELVKLVRSANESLDNLIKIQGQLVQSEKLASLGQLVAGAAHEINNPLAAIVGYSDLLMTDDQVGQSTRQLAEKIGQQARRTKALVYNLLSFARVSPIQKIPLNLNAVVNNALKLRRLDLVGQQIKLDLQCDPNLPMISADPNQILQVLLHVIGNAIDALNEVGGGTLTLRTQCDATFAWVEVSDNGPGLRSPDKVFDPFYTTKPVGKGTGLGLSMAYGIVNKHNGQIICRNNPDRGATFRVALPLTPLNAELAQHSSASAHAN